MTGTQMLLLAATIYAAPHIKERQAWLAVALFVFAGLIAWWNE